MGYTTDFSGEFKLDKPLTDEQANYINKFADTRRMKRDVKKLKELFNGEHGLNGEYGVEGEFFVGGAGFAGQSHDDSIIDYNEAPSTQPSLWCQWNVENNDTIIWDGSEKFYNYVEWIMYYINNFFKPWGYQLSGEVQWQGEDSEDIGKIIIHNNVTQVLHGTITFQ
jgi:hypothetical protein